MGVTWRVAKQRQCDMNRPQQPKLHMYNGHMGCPLGTYLVVPMINNLQHLEIKFPDSFVYRNNVSNLDGGMMPIPIPKSLCANTGNLISIDHFIPKHVLGYLCSAHS